MCHQLEVSRSGYYAWLKRPESARSLENKALMSAISETFEASRQTYGYHMTSFKWEHFNLLLKLSTFLFRLGDSLPHSLTQRTKGLLSFGEIYDDTVNVLKAEVWPTY